MKKGTFGTTDATRLESTPLSRTRSATEDENTKFHDDTFEVKPKKTKKTRKISWPWNTKSGL